MKNRLIRIIQVILTLVMVAVAVVGCAGSPQASKYSADISGRVTIADAVVFPGVNEPIPASEGNVWWVVQVSVRNTSYSQPIEPDFAIQLVPDSWSWGVPCPDYQSTIPTGYSGQFILLYDMLPSYDIGNTQICYQGQKPVSFGKLIKKGNVPVYNCVPPPTPSRLASPKTYTFVADNGETFQGVQLVKEWQGTGDAKLSFALNGMPFLVDYESSIITQVASSFEMCLEETTDIKGVTITVNNSRYPYFPCCTYDAGKSGYWVVAESGKFELNISSSGCNWRVRVGTISN